MKDTKHNAISKMAVEHSHWNGGKPVECACDTCNKRWFELCICTYHNSMAKEYIENLKLVERQNAGLSKEMIFRAISGEFGKNIQILAKKNYKKAFISHIK